MLKIFARSKIYYSQSCFDIDRSINVFVKTPYNLKFAKSDKLYFLLSVKKFNKIDWSFFRFIRLSERTLDTLLPDHLLPYIKPSTMFWGGPSNINRPLLLQKALARIALINNTESSRCNNLFQYSSLFIKR